MMADVPVVDEDPGGGSRLVLYFEDGPLDAEIMQLVCGSIKNVDLIVATDARLGFQLVKAHDFALILMDIMLPDMSGFDVTNALKNTPETRDIPVIAVSATPMPKEFENPGDLGFVAYITKPIDADSMIAAIQSVLNEDAWAEV
jgi:CheY-like chemotaxis protein